MTAIYGLGFVGLFVILHIVVLLVAQSRDTAWQARQH